jgi:hypothetical protein
VSSARINTSYDLNVAYVQMLHRHHNVVKEVSVNILAYIRLGVVPKFRHVTFFKNLGHTKKNTAQWKKQEKYTSIVGTNVLLFVKDKRSLF